MTESTRFSGGFLCMQHLNSLSLHAFSPLLILVSTPEQFMKHCLFTFFILLIAASGFSQNAKEKLLIDQLQTATADSTKIRLTRELAASLSKTNADLAKHYANECLNLSLKTGNKSGEGFSYNLLGGLHLHQSEYIESMELYLKALRIFTELDDKRQISAIYSNIGTLYVKQGNLKEARKNLEFAIELKEKMDPKKGLANSYLSLASVVFMEGDLKQALIYFEKGEQLAQTTKEVYIEAACLNGIAAVQFKKENYSNAVKGYSHVLELYKSFDGDHRKIIAGILHNLASAHRKLGELDKAFELLNASLELAKEIRSNEDIKQAYAGLKAYYKDKGDLENALIAEENHSIYKDSVVNEYALKTVNELQEKYQAEERKNEILKLKETNDQLKEKSRLRYGLLIVSVIALLLILLVVFFYMRQVKERQERKQSELEQKALRAQMNPHFLFNSLNSIQRMYIEGDEDTANDYMADFSRLLRKILENSGKDHVRLKEELNVIQLYMDLEMVRTDHSFEYVCEVADDIDLQQIKIPPLIFQPYLENAIWHGIISKKEKGLITLNIQKPEPGKLICQVIDNGVGFYSGKQLKLSTGNESKGMQITAERLGGNHNVSIEERATGGTCITLTICYTT